MADTLSLVLSKGILYLVQVLLGDRGKRWCGGANTGQNGDARLTSIIIHGVVNQDGSSRMKQT